MVDAPSCVTVAVKIRLARRVSSATDDIDHLGLIPAPAWASAQVKSSGTRDSSYGLGCCLQLERNSVYLWPLLSQPKKSPVM